MKFILLIIAPIAVAILIGSALSSWIWGVISFILSMIAFNWLAVALLGRPTVEQEHRWATGQFDDFTLSGIASETKQVQARLLGPPLELLQKVMVIGEFKNSSHPVIRAFTCVDGVYVQYAQEDHSYAAGDDMYSPDLVFARNPIGGFDVGKYVPGQWEKALDRTFSKVQRLKTALATKDEEAFLASLQEGLDIFQNPNADLDAFRMQARLGFKEMGG